MSCRILITGSRTWPDEGCIALAIRRLVDEYSSAEYVVVHGGAAGADSMAGDAAGWLQQAGFRVSVECHPADWEKYGKRAGFLRNKEMVDLGADVLLAFVHNKSRGASMTLDLANAAGIPCKVYRIDDEVADGG